MATYAIREKVSGNFVETAKPLFDRQEAEELSESMKKENIEKNSIISEIEDLPETDRKGRKVNKELFVKYPTAFEVLKFIIVYDTELSKSGEIDFF